MSSSTAEKIEEARRALAGSRWRLLLHDQAPGVWNMAVDEALLDAVADDKSPPTLRLYGWSPPAVSLGRFQDPGVGIDLSGCAARGWDVVRRPTGGRAVLHDRELTYSIVVPLRLVAGAGVMTSYCVFSRAIHHALSALHPRLALAPGCDRRRAGRNPSCFATATAADGLVGGRKLVGSAQVRRDGALLQHGSILLDVDRQALRELFNDAGDCVTLAELVPRLPALPELERRVADGIGAALGILLELGELTGAEEEAAGARRLQACGAAWPTPAVPMSG